MDYLILEHISAPNYGIPLFINRMAEQDEMGLHGHDGTELTLVTGGTGINRLEDGHSFEVGVGDVYVIHPGLRHAYDTPQKLALVNIIFDMNWLNLPMHDGIELPGYQALFHLEPMLRHRQQFDSRLKLTPKDLKRVETMIADLEALFRSRAPGYGMLCAARMLELIVFLSTCYTRMTTPDSQSLIRLADVMHHIDTHLAEPMALDDLAEMAHMSKSTLVRAFRDATGHAPMDYLIQARLDEAGRLLKRTDESITRIAQQVGIGDSNYFSRVFKKHKGLSPRAFRKVK